MCQFEDDTANLSVGDSDDATLTGSPATVQGFVLPGERPLVADTVEKLCFQIQGLFICDIRRFSYARYEGVM